MEEIIKAARKHTSEEVKTKDEENCYNKPDNPEYVSKDELI